MNIKHVGNLAIPGEELKPCLAQNSWQRRAPPSPSELRALPAVRRGVFSRSAFAFGVWLCSLVAGGTCTVVALRTLLVFAGDLYPAFYHNAVDCPRFPMTSPNSSIFLACPMLFPCPLAFVKTLKHKLRP